MSNEFDINENGVPQLDLEKVIGPPSRIKEELDKVSRGMGYGNISSINQLTLRGFNYFRHGSHMVHGNRDHMGFVFFTRPILNLTYDNLSMVRHLSEMRNAPPLSTMRWCRATLDPWWAQGKYQGQGGGHAGRYGTSNDIGNQQRAADANSSFTPLVDNYNPFIPLLSNQLVSLSGWKDRAINDYTSKAGINNEQWSMVDGFFYKTEVFEMSSSFRSIEGDPISYLFQTWCAYMINCRNWTMNPYPCFVNEREWDYNTKIYRFIMNHDKTYIQKWATTIATPMSNPDGNQFNFQVDKNYIDANAEISITWKCNGAEYNDPIAFYEFNELVSYYCPDLQIQYTDYDTVNNSLKIRNPSAWRKLRGNDEKNRGCYLAIPLINHITRELEWWVKTEDWLKYVATPKQKEEELKKRQEVRTNVVPNSSISG